MEKGKLVYREGSTEFGVVRLHRVSNYCDEGGSMAAGRVQVSWGGLNCDGL